MKLSILKNMNHLSCLEKSLINSTLSLPGADVQGKTAIPPPKIRLIVQSFSERLFDILEYHYLRMKDFSVNTARTKVQTTSPWNYLTVSVGRTLLSRVYRQLSRARKILTQVCWTWVWWILALWTTWARLFTRGMRRLQTRKVSRV